MNNIVKLIQVQCLSIFKVLSYIPGFSYTNCLLFNAPYFPSNSNAFSTIIYASDIGHSSNGMTRPEGTGYCHAIFVSSMQKSTKNKWRGILS